MTVARVKLIIDNLESESVLLIWGVHAVALANAEWSGIELTTTLKVF